MTIRKALVSEQAYQVKTKRVFRQTRASNTARRIIDSATQLLNADMPLSNEAVAEAASVSVSSIYRYFHNRSDLFAEIYRLDAQDTIEKIEREIAQLTQENCRYVVARIISVAAEAVSSNPGRQRAIYGSIEFEVANAVNIQFNRRLQERLIEQIAVVMNCHPRFVDASLVAILGRLLVSCVPQIIVLESSEAVDVERVFSELCTMAGDALTLIMERASVTRG